MFQHTAARRRLGPDQCGRKNKLGFQHTAARRRLVFIDESKDETKYSFNTQPPEGGWAVIQPIQRQNLGVFQHTAARRRLVFVTDSGGVFLTVSTHSRPKAAGACRSILIKPKRPFQHTAARRRLAGLSRFVTHLYQVSTHSRPKAAGTKICGKLVLVGVSTHSRPKAAGNLMYDGYVEAGFQHTAARRRLEMGSERKNVGYFVSTHSRPKAAGAPKKNSNPSFEFQHTAARRRLGQY